MCKYLIWLFFLITIFSSCMSINSSRTELGITQSNVIFSFDDGPDKHTTPLLLDLLLKYEIKALFCLLGENAEQYPELVRRIHDEGHLIVNHGYYDRHARSMNDDDFRNNLIKGDNAISLALGFEMYPKLYRPHGGFYTRRQKEIFIEEGYSIVPANIRVYDAVKTSARKQRIVNSVINKVIKDNGGIILLHDARGSHSRKKIELEKNPDGPFNRLWIVEAVEEIIVSLLEKGFVLHHPNLLAVIGFD